MLLSVAMRLSLLLLAPTSILGASSPTISPNYTSPAGVEIYNPSNFFPATGPWSLVSKAGNTLYIAGMRGIPLPSQANANDTQTPLERVHQAYSNMLTLASMFNAHPSDCVRIVVYVTDMYRFRPLCNEVQEGLWEPGTYPPRSIIEVDRLNEDDIVEVEGTFWLGSGEA